MLKKTHLAIGVAAGLYFVNLVDSKIMFFTIVILGTLFPDIDVIFSIFRSHRKIGVVKSLFSHRGIIHSVTAAVALTVFLSLVYPRAAFPFFLGYGFHLLADSFTPDGIRPFWPLRGVASGKLRTGGRGEGILFVSLLALNAILLIFLII